MEALAKTVRIWVILGMLVVIGGSIASAQGNEIRAVSSPFQEEFEYTVGETLDLNLEIDGIRWTVLRIGAGDPDNWSPGNRVKATFTNEVSNIVDDQRSLMIILLLEDDRGRKLERVELKTIRVGAGNSDEDIQKVKIDSGILAETGKIYLFAEIN